MVGNIKLDVISPNISYIFNRIFHIKTNYSITY